MTRGRKSKKRICKFTAKEKRRRIDIIALYYGCRNPTCAWIGEWLPCQLDFHHYNPANKRKTIAGILYFKEEYLAEEINKCVVLCSNCHRAYHAGQFQLNMSHLCRVDTNLNIITNEMNLDLSPEIRYQPICIYA